MKKETVEIYICDFCGARHENENWMIQHESMCCNNPSNKPCGVCAHYIVGLGCAYNINCDNIGGNVLCMKYKNGTPQKMSNDLLKFISGIGVFNTPDINKIILEGNSSEDTNLNKDKDTD